MQRSWLPETEGRLTLLLCLEQTAPATREQLEEFIMTCGLMNYFEMRSTLEDLVKTRHIAECRDRAGVLLSLSDEGERTLAFFEDRIPRSRRDRIRREAPAWQARFRREQEAPALLVNREHQPAEMHLLAPEDCAPLLRGLLVLRAAPPRDWRVRWQQAAPILAHETLALLGKTGRPAADDPLPPDTAIEPFALPSVLLTLQTGELTLSLRMSSREEAARLAAAWPEARDGVLSLWRRAMGIEEKL